MVEEIVRLLYLQFHPTTLTQEYLRDLDQARSRLDPHVELPDEYIGELRRHALAETVHYSTKIEGNTLTLQQVQSLFAGERVSAPPDQVQEVENYREAVSYIQSLVINADLTITEDTIRTIHYLISKSLPGGYGPGRYRTQQNYVVDRLSQRRLFLPPAPDDIPDLMREFIEWLNRRDRFEPAYKAALTHLNFVAIHPFLDGNGRTARILDSLVMYRGGYKSQRLVSLEAYFGRDTQGYYNALSTALGPHFDPAKDTTAWIDYYLQAHIAQAERALQFISESVAELDGLNKALQPLELTMHQIVALWYACRWGSITNRVYRRITKRSHQTAATDFSRLMDAGLLTRTGRGRSVSYVPAPQLRDIFEETHPSPRPGDVLP